MGFKGKSTQAPKYPSVQPVVLDLHGMRTAEALDVVSKAIHTARFPLHIIVGRGRGATGSILGPAVKHYLSSKGFSWRPARLADGGDGVLVVS